MRIAATIAALAALALATPQQNFTQHTISSEDGFTLPLRFYPPSAGGAPIVVIVHDWGGSLDRWVDIAERLQGHGFGVVLFNLRGHGGSTSAYYYFTDEQVAALREDVELALHFAYGRAGGAVHLLGAGLGANLAVAAAAVEGADRIVALSPGIVYRGIDIREAIAELDPASLLLVASQEDVYSVRSIRELQHLTEVQPESRLLSNAGHGVWILLRQPASIEMIARWLVRRAP